MTYKHGRSGRCEVCDRLVVAREAHLPKICKVWHYGAILAYRDPG